jgi:hypothetical protein
MPGRLTVLGLPNRRVEAVHSAAAGPATTAVPAGVDPAAASDMGRALRVPAFVVVTLALSLGAHLTAGGGPPTLGTALLIGVLLGIAGRLFALREHSLIRLTTLVWSVQAGVHFAFVAGHQHAGAHLIAARLGGHNLHLAPPAPGSGIATPVSSLVAGGLSAQAAAGTVAPPADGSPLLMLTLHAVAGLAAAVWLRRGEAAVFRAARRILPRLLPRRAALPVRPSTMRVLPDCTAPRQPKSQLFFRLASPWRGPPLLPA